MGWACGCRSYSGEGCRAVLWVCKPVVVMVGGFAEGIVVARDMVMEPSPIGFAWGHISSARAIVGVVGVVCSPYFSTASFTVTRVL
jgi:hypothetical protein